MSSCSPPVTGAGTRALAEQDALVLGIDVARYLRHVAARREECSYFAADFEALIQQVQKQLGRPRYTSPVLVGYSSGATLVYATLAQAPPGTFAARSVWVSVPICRWRGRRVAETGSSRSAAPRALPVLPEIEKLHGQRLVCLYGSEETGSLCPTLPPGLATLAERPGAHHFGGDYRGSAERIIAEARPSGALRPRGFAPRALRSRRRSDGRPRFG
ncbi:MAG: AcvB/VirJ family lysyl-phosphatidylglycerol hydrolase [Myxococcota bacterium]